MSSGGPVAAAGRGDLSRGDLTRRALLEAARRVFCAKGYTDAVVADVVAGARASVGSLYHHFGGKSDLYVALFEDYHRRQEERSAAAVRGCRAEGEREPLALFLAGSRAYLQGCWEERDLARLFLAGDGPPGFGLLARRRYREWLRRNATLLGPMGEALVMVLTTVLSEAGHEVSLRDTERSAHAFAEEILALVARIGGG